jgi:hypothetical protein
MNATQTITEYLAENADWLDENAADIEQIPAEAWPIIRAIALDEGGWDEPGIDCDVAITHETLSDFDASRINHWNERGTREEIEAALPATRYVSFQLAKGQQRREMIVVDCGDLRVCLSL